MKKIALVILIFTILIGCKEDTLKSDRFKTGTFEIPAGKGYEKTIIIRQDSLQIEKYQDRTDTLE